MYYGGYFHTYCEVTESVTKLPDIISTCVICRKTKKLKYQQWYFTAYAAICDICLEQIIRDVNHKEE